MSDIFLADAPDAIPVLMLDKESLQGWLESAAPAACNWVAANGFEAEAGSALVLPDANGRPTRVLAGSDGPGDMWAPGGLPRRLRSGAFRIENDLDAAEATRAATAWGLGCYAFDAYSDSKGRGHASLVWPANADRERRAGDGRGAGNGARPHQYACQRHGAGAAGSRRPGTRHPPRRAGLLHRRR